MKMKAFLLATLFVASAYSKTNLVVLPKAVDPNNANEYSTLHKQNIVSLIKKEESLTKKYKEQMDLAYDYLDPEDPIRLSASDMENLGDWSLSLWTPSGSFRIGGGDHSLCQDPNKYASFDAGTMLVGFDTSYKRESVYGFWALVSYTYNYCHDDNEPNQIGRGQLEITHRKWVPVEKVDDLLNYFEN